LVDHQGQSLRRRNGQVNESDGVGRSSDEWLLISITLNDGVRSVNASDVDSRHLIGGTSGTPNLNEKHGFFTPFLFPMCCNSPQDIRKGATMTRRNLLIALLSATALIGAAVAQKQAIPKKPTNDSLAEENVKELLLLMDTNKDGKISKQEWMTFMEAQFDKLDKDKKGELDRKELLKSTVSVNHVRYSDLGK
jgi:EF hand domain-containing protein